MPIIVIGILNFKNIENNFKPLLLLSLLFLIGVAVIPIRGPIHFAPVWILIATLSAIFFVKVIPEIHGLKNSINKSKLIFLWAPGKEKNKIVKKIRSDYTKKYPASFLRKKNNFLFYSN